MTHISLPSEAIRAAATAARQSALVAWLDPADELSGLADLRCLHAVGKDAASFLHSQLTNEVNKLEPGQGNLSARVSRTGHLQQVFSLHRLTDVDHAYLMLVEGEAAQELHDGLDGFLFSDVLTLELAAASPILLVQGPDAAERCEAIFGPLGFEPWSTLPEHAVRPIRRARHGLPVPDGTRVVRRSLTGDVGFLIFPGGPAEALVEAMGEVVRGAEAVETLELLRIEAGIPRVGPETAGKRRLLPETGIEQHAVSYTKGCYLGQEVIARVRTYGSVPNLLRALVFESTVDPAAIPAPGEPVLNLEGKKLGVYASRTWSVEAQAPVAMAYLGRNHRAPGAVHATELGAATVALLPLYSSPDSAGRVQHLYDRGIRAFAGGDATKALELLDEALRIDPGFADAYEVIGVILGKAGNFHEAIDFFRRLEEVAPSEPLVNTNLSLYYMKIGDRETAEDEAGKATLKSMAKARGKSGGDVDADLAASKRKDASRKLGMFEQVLDFDPVDPIALFGMGASLLTLERYEESAGYLAKATEVDKNNSAIYVARGKALEKLDRTEEAMAVYRAGLDVASRQGDLMPLKEMEHRLLLLGR